MSGYYLEVDPRHSVELLGEKCVIVCLPRPVNFSLRVIPMSGNLPHVDIELPGKCPASDVLDEVVYQCERAWRNFRVAGNDLIVQQMQAEIDELKRRIECLKG